MLSDIEKIKLSLQITEQITIDIQKSLDTTIECTKMQISQFTNSDKIIEDYIDIAEQAEVVLICDQKVEDYKRLVRNIKKQLEIYGLEQSHIVLENDQNFSEILSLLKYKKYAS